MTTTEKLMADAISSAGKSIELMQLRAGVHIGIQLMATPDTNIVTVVGALFSVACDGMIKGHHQATGQDKFTPEHRELLIKMLDACITDAERGLHG